MLGDLSAKYESNGDPGAISSGWGDAGGVSYGCYQLSSEAGSVQSFLRWLRESGHTYGHSLGSLEPCTNTFNELWRRIAALDGDNFLRLQHEYIKAAYYDPAIEALRANYYTIEKHYEVMQDVVWSRAVQYGVGNIVEMFETAVKSLGYPNLSYVDAPEFDASMIRAVYLNVCRSVEWTNGSPGLRKGLYDRFENECVDALRRL